MFAADSARRACSLGGSGVCSWEVPWRVLVLELGVPVT